MCAVACNLLLFLFIQFEFALSAAYNKICCCFGWETRLSCVDFFSVIVKIFQCDFGIMRAC